ncbi:MAG: CoA-binding protein [Chloroflexi bacterium]|nr:CoA-binding protein [Chloroflexota bacterium]
MMTSTELRELLDNARVIAVVGHSDSPTRTSYRIAQYLRQMGYKVYPVNPTVDEIDGEKSYPSLASVPEQIDIVNVFRRSEHLPGVVEEAIAVGAGAVWAQLGVEHPEAARLAEEANLPIVMNNCIKVSHGMLV